MSIGVHAEKTGGASFTVTRCGHLSNLPMVLGHWVNKEMTNQEHSGLVTRKLLQGLACWPEARKVLFLLQKAFQREGVFRAALATSGLEFMVFGLGWPDMCHATPGMETDAISDW